MNQPFLNDQDFFKSNQQRESGQMIKSKSSEDKALDKLKKILVAILEKNEGLEKSMNQEGIDLIKGRGYPIGTVREWKGKEYKKVAKDRWLRQYTGEEGRGMNIALGKVKKKIANAKTIEELAQIVRENKKRFQTADGSMNPIVKGLLALSKDVRSELSVKEKTQLVKDFEEARKKGDKKEMARIKEKLNPEMSTIERQKMDELNAKLDKKYVDTSKQRLSGKERGDKKITPNDLNKDIKYTEKVNSITKDLSNDNISGAKTKLSNLKKDLKEYGVDDERIKKLTGMIENNIQDDSKGKDKKQDAGKKTNDEIFPDILNSTYDKEYENDINSMVNKISSIDQKKKTIKFNDGSEVKYLKENQDVQFKEIGSGNASKDFMMFVNSIIQKDNKNAFSRM